MTKSTLLPAMLIGTALGATGAGAETMIFATDLPPTHYVSVHSAEPLMKCITEGTAGAIAFEYMHSGQLVKRDQAVSALHGGLADFVFGLPALETATIPLTNVTMLPGLSGGAVEATNAWRKTLDGGGVLAREIENANLKLVSILLLNPYQIVGTQAYAEVADWQGKKIRTTGSALNFMVDSIGAVPVQMSATELYTAMLQKTVDATVLPVAAIKSYSVHEIATHISANGSFGTSASFLGMSLSGFNSLPADQQKVIDDCGRRIEQETAAWIEQSEAAQMDEFKAAGITIYAFTPEQLAAMSEAMKPAEADFVGRLKALGLPAQEALDEFKAALGR